MKTKKIDTTITVAEIFDDLVKIARMNAGAEEFMVCDLVDQDCLFEIQNALGNLLQKIVDGSK